MKLVVTFRELIDKGVWDDYCEAHGLSVWCVNEGQADSSEACTLTLEEARKYQFLLGEDRDVI